jgi:ATP-binding cassette subfamily B protein
MEPGFTYRLRARLSSNALDGVLARPAALAIDKPMGDVISRFGADADEVGVYGIWSASNVSRLVIAAVALAIMLYISPVVTAALVAPIVVFTLAGRRISKHIGRARARSRQAGGQVGALVGEIVNAFLPVQAARAERRMTSRLEKVGAERLKAAVREELLIACQGALFTNVAALGTGLVLLVAASQLRTGSFSVGDLALFAFYIQFIGEAVNALGMFMSRIKRASLSLARLAEIGGGMGNVTRNRITYVDSVPPPPAAPVPDGPLRSLRLTGLTYRYPSASAGITDVSLEVTGGTLAVITGRVGSGKSTLLRAMLGLLPADSGSVAWNDQVIGSAREFLIPPRSGYVPQVPHLFSGSLRDNVLLGLSLGDEEVLTALQAAAFEDDLAAMPEGLDTIVGPRGLRLSGGQRQRIAAARMIVRRPQLMVCDDLSNALDAGTEAIVWDRLLAQGATVIAVTHRRHLMERADQLILLRDHSLLDAGPPAELMARHEDLTALPAPTGTGPE